MDSYLDERGEDLRRSVDYDRRILQARRRAAWELGDPTWANVLLSAWLFPDADAKRLEEEKRA